MRVAARLRPRSRGTQGARPRAQPGSPGPPSGLRAGLCSCRLARHCRPPRLAIRLSASHSTYLHCTLQFQAILSYADVIFLAVV